MKLLQKYNVWLVLVGVVVVSFFTYSLTAARLLQNYADSTDLILAGYVNGLAHPPGYVLLTFLLHGWLSLWSGDVFRHSSLLMALIQAVANGVFALVVLEIVGVITGSKKGWVGVAGLTGLLWGLSLNVWQHAVVVEVFALAHLLMLLFLLVLFKSLKNGREWLVLLVGVAGGMALGYHPLSLLVVGTGVTFWAVGMKKRGQLDLRKALILSLGGVVSWLIVALLLPRFGFSETYSWSTTETIQLIRNYLRLDYSPGGSAVETYSSQFSLFDSLRALVFWLKQQLGLGLVYWGLALLGLLWVFRKNRLLFYWLTASLVASGPLLVMYMKFPVYEQMFDVEFFWGVALRMRMLFVFEMLLGLTTSLGLIAVLNYLKTKDRRTTWAGLALIVVMLCMASAWNYAKVDLSESNFADLYTRRILKSLPEESVLMVDSDMAFGFLGQQIVNEVGEDVVIYPVNIGPRPGFKRDVFLSQSESWLSAENAFHIPHLTAELLEEGVRVYWYDPQADLIELVGLEGNPYYAVPYGYVVEIRDEPPSGIEAYDYGLSVALAELETEANDWWLNGLKAHLAATHARAGYYAARAGFGPTADIHQELALRLSSSELSKSQVREAIGQGKAFFNQYQSYMNYKPISSDEFLGRADEAQTDEERLYLLTRALLKDTGSRNARQMLQNEVGLLDQDLSDYLRWLSGES